MGVTTVPVVWMYFLMMLGCSHRSEVQRQKSGVAQREGGQRVSFLGMTESSVGIVKGTDAKFLRKVGSMWRR